MQLLHQLSDRANLLARLTGRRHLDLEHLRRRLRRDAQLRKRQLLERLGVGGANALERRVARALGIGKLGLGATALHRVGRDNSQIHRHHGWQLNLLDLDTGIDFTTDQHRLATVNDLDAAREGRLRPAQDRRESLSNIVAFVVSGELAHQHQLGLLALDQLGQRLGDDAGVQLIVFGVDANGLIGAHCQCRAQLRRHIGRPERGHRHLPVTNRRVGAVLGQSKSSLDRVLVKLVELPVGAAEVEGIVLEFELLGWIGNPLGGDEDLHGHSLIRVDATGNWLH